MVPYLLREGTLYPLLGGWDSWVTFVLYTLLWYRLSHESPSNTCNSCLLVTCSVISVLCEDGDKLWSTERRTDDIDIFYHALYDLTTKH